MNEQILSRIKQLIEENGEISYPPLISKNEFEQTFASFSEEVTKKIKEAKIGYDQALNSPDDEVYKKVIKITEDEFANKYKRYCDEEDKLKESYNLIIKSRFQTEVEFPIYLGNKSEITTIYLWLKSVGDFLNERKESLIDFPANESLIELFKRQTFDSYELNNDTDTYLTHIVNGIKKSYEYYMENYMGLLEMSEKYLKYENISPLSNWVVNLGHTNRSIDARGYMSLINGKNKKTISGGYSSPFINVFITNANELTKISIGPKGLLKRTPYIINKDIQKIDIIDGFIVEFHQHKHFESETIVFASDEDAYKFQADITSKRQFRPQSNFRNR